MPRPDRAVDQGLRLADHGACVPWDALSAVERVQQDAAAHRRLSEGRHDVVAPAGWSLLGRLRQALAATLGRSTGRSR
jgi:hypothetical protein